MASSTGSGLLLIQVMLRSALSFLATLRENPHDEPARGRAAEVLRLSFGQIWLRVPVLTLEITEERAVWQGRPVLEAEDDREGLLRTLSGAGLVSLDLRPGVESGEVHELLFAVHRARAGVGPDCDLATLLFRADLRLLTYEIEEPPVAQPTPRKKASRARPPRAAAVNEAVRNEAAAEGRPRGVVDLEKFDSTLYFLDPREIESLRSAIDEEYSRDVAMSALALLLDTLELRPEPEVRAEVLGVLTDLLPHLLSEGRFDAVAYLLGESRDVAKGASGWDPAHLDTLQRLRSSVSEPRAVSQLFHALDTGGVRPTAQSMGILLRELRPHAIRQVLAWTDLLSTPDARRAVEQALDDFFSKWPNALGRMLNAGDADVIEAAIELAIRLKLPGFVDPLRNVAEHPDPSVRVHVARAFAAIGSSDSLRSLLSMADDTEARVRLEVWRTFVGRPHRGALRTLEAAVAGRDIEERGRREKRALFTAYGAVAGSEGIETLSELLRGKSPSRARLSAHTRACAALALGVVGTPHARKVLERAADDHDPVVRTAVRNALRGGAET